MITPTPFLLVRAACIWAHPVRGESHIQRNDNREVSTTSYPFCNEPHRSHIFLWSLHQTRHSHPGHSTVLMRSESPSGKCAKLHTVAASNNRDHMPWSLYFCLFARHIYEQGYHTVLISKICPCFALHVLENITILISNICSYLRLASLYFLIFCSIKISNKAYQKDHYYLTGP